MDQLTPSFLHTRQMRTVDLAHRRPVVRRRARLRSSGASEKKEHGGARCVIHIRPARSQPRTTCNILSLQISNHTPLSNSKDGPTARPASATAPVSLARPAKISGNTRGRGAGRRVDGAGTAARGCGGKGLDFVFAFLQTKEDEQTVN